MICGHLRQAEVVKHNVPEPVRSCMNFKSFLPQVQVMSRPVALFHCIRKWCHRYLDLNTVEPLLVVRQLTDELGLCDRADG
jgi:hypothetical protein